MEILALVFLLELSGADGYSRLYEPPISENETYEFTTYITLGVKAYICEFFYISGTMKALTNLKKGKTNFSFNYF